MIPTSEIITERLRLRRPQPNDAELVFENYARDPEVSRFLAWRPHRELRETQDYITTCIDAWHGTMHRPYLIDANGHQAIGVFDLRLRSGPGAVSFGYVLARAFWNRGYMTEALKAVIALALAQHDVWRVWAFCDVENHASARVMEKAGMEYEGTLRRWAMHPNIDPIAPRDCRCYSRVK